MKKVAVLNIGQLTKPGNQEEFFASTLENHLINAHKDIAHPHSHDFYLAILFTQGSGTHEVDFTTYKVTPGDLFLLNPGQTHHWELSEDVRGYVFFHTAAFYNIAYTQRAVSHYPFFYSMHNPPLISLRGQCLNDVTGLFRRILEEYNSDNLLRSQMLLNLCDTVYIEATREYLRQHPGDNINVNGYYARFRKFEELVEANFTTEKSPAAYAEMMHISPKHLNRIVQAVVGKSTGDVIAGRVVLEAKKLLILQKNSFNEIAHALGYEDYAYFSRLFKNRTGDTPSEFLKRYKRG